MSGRARVLERGPTRAESRYGPSKVQGGTTEDLADRLAAAIEAGDATVSEIPADCPFLERVASQLTIGSLSDVDQATLADRLRLCREARATLSGVGNVVSGTVGDVLAIFTPGRIFEIVGNGVIALTGGLMLWLGAQRTFGR